MLFPRRIAVLASLCAFSASAQTILVQPYLQPGDGSVLGATDVKVIAWMTDANPGEFKVEYGTTTRLDKSASPKKTSLDLGNDAKYLTYSAVLNGLPMDADVHYRVTLAGKKVQEGQFHTRKPANRPVKFIVVGDTADGRPNCREVAYQMWQVKPEFMLVVGDICYAKGRVSEYLKHFWDVYNTDTITTNGVPLMRNTTLYAVLGNHDIGATNLGVNPDGFGAYYFFHPPLNGPKPGLPTPILGPDDKVAAFKAAAGTTYPALNNYSFDNGPVHFLCLDGNKSMDPMDPGIQAWVRQDLKSSKARWKLAFFHQPGFHSSTNHYAEQKMRLFEPLFEEGGVDVVLAGHVHNYQRSKPLRFEPSVTKADAKGVVAGKFTIDNKFDGVQNTKPEGIIHIVTGGGGAKLYNTNFTDNPKMWEHDPANWAPYTSKFIADRHSFSVVEADSNRLVLRQLDSTGKEVDRMVITKAGTGLAGSR
jgi:predicted phosphodiesterase